MSHLKPPGDTADAGLRPSRSDDRDQSSDVGQEHWRKALDAWARFDIEAAIHFSRLAGSRHPRLAQSAALLQCKALLRLNREAEAVALMRDEQSQGRGTAELLTILTEALLFGAGDCTGALDVCFQALAQGQGNASIMGYKALAMSRTGDYSRALAVLEEAQNTMPHKGFLRVVEAQVHQERGQHHRALASFNQLLSSVGLELLASDRERRQLWPANLRCEAEDHTDQHALVSVVMTTYGWHSLVRTAIDSVLRQSYRNLELIIVDDASPDDTVAKLRGIAARDQRVKIIRSSPNRGTYCARNLGIQRAQGEYIAFMDSDDWCHPRMLQRRVEALQDEQILGVTCSFVRIDDQGNIEFKPEPPLSQALVSLCFKREPVVSKLGYFDAVRVAGDLEYSRRFVAAFGDNAIKKLPEVMLISGRHRASITGGGQFMHYWHGPIADVARYRQAYTPWHGLIREKKAGAYLPHPLETRPFSAPDRILA